MLIHPKTDIPNCSGLQRFHCTYHLMYFDILIMHNICIQSKLKANLELSEKTSEEKLSQAEEELLAVQVCRLDLNLHYLVCMPYTIQC